MGLTLAQKLIKSHLVEGEMKVGTEIGLRIDQTLTQDATGTMAYLEFEAMGVDRVKTERSVAYIDHNTLQTGFENADDHRFIQTVTKKHGIYFSRPGNGICHQVHLERFGIPGKTLIGSDSHTPTGGGIGMLAMGAGGLDVAVAMGGGTYYIPMPKMTRINLTGYLKPWVSAKDVILEVLRRMSVKGGVGKIIEYGGEGVKTLSVPERATITNMGAELGATTSIFPSDEITLAFLKAQGREKDWTEILPDSDAEYDEVINIDLCSLTPMAACPHMPDNVKTTDEIGKLKVDQVAIGSCTNSSYVDMMKVAAILKGKTVCPSVSLCIAPGSKQVLNMLALNGALSDMIDAGARILESACGPCIGMGQSPNSGGVSLRTFNRNFEGRSGTKDGKIYLVSPEVAAASALTGVSHRSERAWRRAGYSRCPRSLLSTTIWLNLRLHPRRQRMLKSSEDRTSSRSRKQSRFRKKSKQRLFLKSATTSQPTILCRQVQKFFLIVQTSLTFHNTVSAFVTKHSLRESRRRARALSSAVQTTVKAHQESTPHSFRFISALKLLSQRALQESMLRTL